jgi:hypothetical protein
MKRGKRRATAAEQRKYGLTKDTVVEDVDLHDPNLAPEHRERFIAMIKAEVTRLDETIGLWYRHRGECRIEGCDCGGNNLIEQADSAARSRPTGARR